MNQSRAFFISLLCALVGMAIVGFYIAEREQSITDAQGTPVQVLVATRDINEMQQIEDGMFAARSVPSIYLQPSAIVLPGKDKSADAQLLRDIQEMIALVPIKANEQLVMTKLAPKGTETGLATQVPANKRAMSIPVDEVSGVNKLIKPGDHVDIIASISYPGPDGNKQTELKTLLQNINILAVGEIIQNNIPKMYENDPLTQKKVAVSGRGERGYATVTIEVTPEQSQILLYQLAGEVRLFLTLRNPVDRVESAVGTTTIDEVLGPDSKRGEARDKEQKRILDEAQRAAAELARQQALKDAAAQGQGPKRAPASDPLESGGGVLE